MKKIITLCISLSLFQSASAQVVKDTEKLNVVSKGKNVVNLYYGVSIVGAFYKSVVSQSGIDVKTKTLGPLGLVYEHLVTDNIGIGAEFGYTNVYVGFSDSQTYFTSGGASVTDVYLYEYNFNTVRAMFRANFHFADSEKFDAYGLLSAGYRHTTFSFKTSDPYYTGSVSITNPIPVGLKPGIGFRYFFTDAVGLNIELALGTPLMCGGLSFKF